MSVIDEIAAERRRQIEVGGWTAEHDDGHSNAEMASAAICYATPHRPLSWFGAGLAPVAWPWHWSWWKSTDRRRDLIKAGALIVAEIERLGRAGGPPWPGAGGGGGAGGRRRAR